jgi:hypothetical protein
MKTKETCEAIVRIKGSKLYKDLEKLSVNKKCQLIFNFSEIGEMKLQNQEYGSYAYMRGGPNPKIKTIICSIQPGKGWYDNNIVRNVLNKYEIKCDFQAGYVWENQSL